MCNKNFLNNHDLCGFISKDIVVKDITCPFCDKNDFKSKRGLSCHITRMHRSSTDGRGSRPSTGTRDRKDDRVGITIHDTRPLNQDIHRISKT